jgi:cytochrome c556
VKVRVKMRLMGMTAAALLLLILGSGCASQPIEQQKPTTYMKSTVGTPDELCPLAPGEAKHIRKVGNQWVCELHGQTMVYNDATSRWEPKGQAGQKK